MRSTVIMSMATGTGTLAMHLLRMKEKVTNCQTLERKGVSATCPTTGYNRRYRDEGNNLPASHL